MLIMGGCDVDHRCGVAMKKPPGLCGPGGWSGLSEEWEWVEDVQTTVTC